MKMKSKMMMASWLESRVMHHGAHEFRTLSLPVGTVTLFDLALEIALSATLKGCVPRTALGG